MISAGTNRPARDVLSPVARRLGRTDAAAYRRVMDRIVELDLTGNLLERETEGYTVLRGVLTQDRIARSKTAILRRVEARTGRLIDP